MFTKNFFRFKFLIDQFKVFIFNLIQNLLILIFLAPAVVSDVKVTEIQDNRGIETGKLHVEWRKSDGGDEIDEFLIECKAGSFLLSETVSFISGQVNYEHNTTNVVQGVNISVTIYAINSAGNSSISSMISTGNKAFFPYFFNSFNCGKLFVVNNTSVNCI